MSNLIPKTAGCRVCGNTAERLRRGLCQRHYRRFTRKLDGLSPEEAKAFEERCVEEGWIEIKKQGQREKVDPDPFDELLAEVKAEFESDIAPHVAEEKRREVQEEILRQAKATKKRSTKRKAE